MSEQQFGRDAGKPIERPDYSRNTPRFDDVDTSFGVLNTFASGFGAFRRNFLGYLAIAAVCSIPGLLPVFALGNGTNPFSGVSLVGLFGAIFLGVGVISFIPLLIGMIAAITLTHDALLSPDRRADLDLLSRFKTGLVRFIPALMGFLFILLGVGGIFLLVSATLFATGDGFAVFFGALAALIAVLAFVSTFSVLLPAIAVERNGFGAVKRAWTLAGGYLLPLFGLLMLTFLFDSFVIGPLGSLIGVAINSMLPSSGATVAITWFTQFMVLMFTIFFGIIIQTAAFVRLKVIKEGLAEEDVADVFR
ncbi:MAG: hypothetical protein AAFQ10_01515 [Pseudomonadota bacterium]